MERISTKLLQNRFMHLCDALGKSVAGSGDRTIGAWRLEYIGCYGGWKIVELLGSGGESEPFGCERRTTREMFEVINFALRAIQIDRSGSDDPRYWPMPKIENRGAAQIKS